MGDGSKRIVEIDRFRGLSIVLMVFFTLTLILSNDLPELIKHNQPSSLHLGDFVLPMFLFSSGMSLVFFHRKRAGKPGYALDLAERLGLFGIIWAMLSPFTGGGFFEMDELALSLVLSVPTLIIMDYSDAAMIILAIAIMLSYPILGFFGLLPDFNAHYLGGFAAALFYLPVMLAGAYAGRNLDKVEKLIMPALAIGIFFLLVVPPYKLIASPSFMALSVGFSLIVFALLKRFSFPMMEYLGASPLRYWVMMFVLVIVPIAYYAAGTGSGLPLKIDWTLAVVISLAILIALFCVSLALDHVIRRMKTR